MLSELALTCLEAAIYEFGALSLGGEDDFEDLSPRAKVRVLDMLATIRELQAQVRAIHESPVHLSQPGPANV